MDPTTSVISTSCLRFPNIARWSWSKTAALSFVLSTIALVSTYFAGGHGVGELCAAAGAPFIAILLIRFFYARKNASQAVQINVSQDSPYDLTLYQADITRAVREGKSLSWTGMPWVSTSTWILPNVSVGEGKVDFSTQNKPYGLSTADPLKIICRYRNGDCRGIGCNEIPKSAPVENSNFLMYQFFIAWRQNARGNRDYYYQILKKSLKRRESNCD